jgi:hypothetical protein
MQIREGAKEKARRAASQTGQFLKILSIFRIPSGASKYANFFEVFWRGSGVESTFITLVLRLAS